MDSAAISRWVKDGKLHRKYRTVYTLGHDALSREGEFLAVVYAGGLGSVLSHDALAELYRVRRGRADVIDVVVPRRRVAPPGTRFHQTRNLDPRDVTTYKGIPVTTIPRLLVDLTDTTTDDELANVIHEADFRGWFDEAKVHEAKDRAFGRHNLDVLERALELRKQGSAGTKSKAERAALARLREQGESPLPNVQVEGFEVDLYWPSENRIVEIDPGHHGRPRTQADDELRDAALEAAGYEVRRVANR